MAINIQHFGAVGNGITDDAAAIQVAGSAAYGRLKQPPHRYIPPSLSDPSSEEIWHQLSLFHTRDLLDRLYRCRHKRDLQAAKAREILSHLVQAREYFAAAATAAEVVRPLLQYYGVLALSRSVILFIKPELRECGLAKAHGLSADGWDQVLSRGIANAGNLPISVTNGTLLQLLEVTHNEERTAIFFPPIPTRMVWTATGNLPNPGLSIIAKQFLKCVPDLSDLYEEIFNELSACHNAFVFHLSETTHTDFDVFAKRTGLVDPNHLRHAFSISEDVEIRTRPKHNFAGPIPHRTFRIQHSTIGEAQRLVPPIKNDSAGNTYLVEPLPDGTRVSSLGLLFIISYFLGMLVRYYPSHWLEFLQHQKGDFLFPLLHAASELIQRRFPALILDEFEKPGSI